MANAAPKLEIGKLTPEDSERLAASFRPAWELDDAPFAQGNGLSAEDIDALAGGAGVASSVRGASTNGVRAADAEIEIDLEPDATPARAPVVAEARPQQQAKPSTPRAPPPTVKIARDAASGEYSAVKKSNTGIIVGIAAVVVVVGGIFGVRAVMSGDKPVSKTNTTANTNAMGPNIPPPPDNVTTAVTTTQTAATVTPPPPVQKANDAVPVRTFPETATTTAPTHQTVAPPIHTTTVATHATTQPTHTAAGKPPSHGSIVRDNPF
jgi:hypothetical protein